MVSPPRPSKGGAIPLPEYFDVGELVRKAQAALVRQMNAIGVSAQIEAGNDCAELLRLFAEAVTVRRQLHTRDQVSEILNRAADEIRDDDGIFEYETSETIRAQSLMDLLVNAAMCLLDNPDMSLDEVMSACYIVEEQSCEQCGGDVFEDDSGFHHRLEGKRKADVPQDADHAPVPHPRDAAEMVREWVSL
jgi:hypothetical protein